MKPAYPHTSPLRIYERVVYNYVHYMLTSAQTALCVVVRSHIETELGRTVPELLIIIK